MFPPSGNHFRFDILTRAWSYFQQQAAVWVGAALLACGIEFGVVQLLLQVHGRETLWWYLMVATIAGAVHRTLLAGLCRIALCQVRGEPVRIRDLFLPRAGFGVTFATCAVAALAIQVGYTFFLVPGILLNTLLMLLEPILADRRITLRDALELSARTIQAELITAICFSFLLGWLASVGSVFFGHYAAFGAVVLYPLIPLALTILYRSFFPYTRYDAVE